MNKHTSKSVMILPHAGNGQSDALHEAITARIAALEKERAAYVEEANRMIASYNAAIGELTRLLEPEPPPIQSSEENG